MMDDIEIKISSSWNVTFTGREDLNLRPLVPNHALGSALTPFEKS